MFIEVYMTVIYLILNKCIFRFENETIYIFIIYTYKDKSDLYIHRHSDALNVYPNSAMECKATFSIQYTVVVSQ